MCGIQHHDIMHIYEGYLICTCSHQFPEVNKELHHVA